MSRILVTGNVGSGKTTLSRKLGRELGLPVVHLDQVVWRPGWQKAPEKEISENLARITSEPAWIIDGVSSRACEMADVIIFLDLPVSACLRRALRRTVRHLFSQRPEVPERCPEIRITWRMIRLLFAFPKQTRPKLLAIGERSPSGRRVLHIRSAEELERLSAPLLFANS